METIIFFVNGARVNELQSYTLSWTTAEVHLKNIIISDKKKILFAFDRLDEEKVKELVEIIDNNSDVYILRHTYPCNSKLEILYEFLKNKNCSVKGNIIRQHNDIEYKMIQQFDEFIINEQTTTFSLEKAFDELKGMISGNSKLEASLEFLHKCLIEKPNDLSLLEIAFNTEEIDKIKIDFIKFKLNENETLIPLRDTLLKLTGM